jgi:sec-independent protein translocase protein TatA
MWGNLTGVHLIILVLVVLVLFGATKLPIFAKGLGQSIKIFKKEMEDVRGDDKKSTPVVVDPERPVVYTNTTEPPATGTQARRAPDER